MITDHQVFEVRKWWNERINDGCQFEFFEETRMKADWRGEGKWKRFVRVVSLKVDYERSRGVELRYFHATFIRAAQHDDVVTKLVPIDIGYNVTMLRPMPFYRFRKQLLTPLPV